MGPYLEWHRTPREYCPGADEPTDLYPRRGPVRLLRSSGGGSSRLSSLVSSPPPTTKRHHHHLRSLGRLGTSRGKECDRARQWLRVGKTIISSPAGRPEDLSGAMLRWLLGCLSYPLRSSLVSFATTRGAA